MPLAPGIRLGSYEILTPIGAGGMGEVYKARDTRLDRTVAIKVIAGATSAQKERFELEGRTVAGLQHPHICALYDIGQQDGLDYLVMEYLEGKTLAERLESGPLPLAECLRYATQIAGALDQAHRRNVVHRDLKPGNVLLTASGAKLLDFGLAKIRQPAPEKPHNGDDATLTIALTVEGTVLGTAPYMSPERVHGKEADPRSDIFSLGATLYEMVTGTRAFNGKSAMSVMMAVVEHDPPPVSSLTPIAPPALDWLVEVCLAKDPDERWQTAREVLRELKRVTTQPVVAESRPVASRRWWIAATAALGAALVGSLVMMKPTEPQPVRFHVYTPEKTTAVSTPVISPDGRKIAFTATIAGGKRVLYVRALDSLTAQPLPETTGAAYPFWSPDGRFVGFFADGRLKRIDVMGGPPQTLCDFQLVRGIGGTWSPEGVIVFASGGELKRVSAAGGVPVTVTEPDPSKGGPLSAPQFLPDGRHFLYRITRTVNSEGPGVYAGSIDTKDPKERKLVLAAGSSAIFAPRKGNDGYLLFKRERTLMAQPFDAASLQLRAEPFPLAQEMSAGPILDASASSNGVLAYATGGASFDRQLAWFDRAGGRLAEFNPPRQFVRLNLSPDEKRLAIGISGSAGVDTDVWVLELARGSFTKLTFAPDFGNYPVWSPEGGRIAFRVGQGDRAGIQQKASSGAGSGETLITSPDGGAPMDWSRDGRYIVFDRTDPKTGRDIWVWDVQEKASPLLKTGFNEQEGQFSPDGHWLAYTSDESNTPQVYVQSFPPSGGKWQISSGGGVQPRWRRDGKELYYIAPDLKLMAVPVKTGAAFETGTPVALFETRTSFNAASFGHEYAVSGDGKRFLIIGTVEQAAQPEPMTVMVNWMTGLK